MASVTALRKHPCPECGGDAEWNADKQALGCPYCGTVLPYTPGEDAIGQEIKEHDLVQTLKSIPQDQRGWHDEKTTVLCQSCHAISVFDATRQAQRCDFCGSPSLAPYQGDKDAITPESVLPFKLSESQVRDLLRQWYGSHWFAPDRLKKAALTDTLHGIYLPYWTFDSHVSAQWQAMSGYYYYEVENYRDAQGNIAQRQVQKVRWEPSSGQIARFFDDDLVPGTGGVRMDLLRGVEPFPTTSEELKSYDPAFVRGWTVERYQVDLREAAEANLEQMEAVVQRLCASEVPGDTYRDLEIASDYRGRTFKHVLVPIWLINYTYGPKTFQIIVNGATGQISGEHPKSWVKIFFFVILPILIFLIMMLVMSGQ